MDQASKQRISLPLPFHCLEFSYATTSNCKDEEYSIAVCLEIRENGFGKWLPGGCIEGSLIPPTDFSLEIHNYWVFLF